MATKELQAILRAHERAREQNLCASLVTVFETAGSTYRRSGARMLVLADPAGRIGPGGLGSISGGCLEDDVRERARHVMETGRAVAVCYDTTAEADVILGSGVGCQGVVHVLIQPLPPASENPLVHVARAMSERRTGALATVCATQDGSLAAVGQFLWVDAAGQPSGTLIDSALVQAIADMARDVVRNRRSVLRAFPDQEGRRVDVFIDPIYPPHSLLICGAGDDAIPLAGLAKELGWRVRVVDGRRAYVLRERFPGVDELVVCPPREFGNRHAIEPGEAVVLMTHNYFHDLEFLRAALVSSAAYVGILGPRRRTERLFAALHEERERPANRRCSARIHGPVGLDIGAEAPEQIALAILAEIQAFSVGRDGGSLKHRRAPLHEASGHGVRSPRGHEGLCLFAGITSNARG